MSALRRLRRQRRAALPRDGSFTTIADAAAVITAALRAAKASGHDVRDLAATVDCAEQTWVLATRAQVREASFDVRAEPGQPTIADALEHDSGDELLTVIFVDPTWSATYLSRLETSVAQLLERA